MARGSGKGGVPGSEDATVLLPASVGPHVIMRQLGAGGMGVVSLCRTPSGRLVAVKQVREEFADDPVFRGRFRREVTIARRVSGVYTVPVVDADVDGPRPWVATVYIPGPTLGEAVRMCGGFPEAGLRALGVALAEALQAIHAAGLVHRDLKPGNVLLSGDGPRVIDFGIARALGETRLTGTGTVIGSPAFMAPEQAVSAHDVGPECDVFALAGVLVHAACGEGPFGPGDVGALHRIVSDEPDLHGVPPALRTLLLRCLDKTPARRPTLEEVITELSPADPADLLLPALREDLAARADEAALMAVAPPPPALAPDVGRNERRVGRRGVLIGGLAALGVLAAGAGTAAVLRGRDGPADPVGRPSGTDDSLGARASTIKLTDPPAPLWTTTLKMASTMPRLHAFRSTVLLHELSYTAAAFDARSGKSHWWRGAALDGRSQVDPEQLDLGTNVFGPVGERLLVTQRGSGLESLGKTFLATVDPATPGKGPRTELASSFTPVMLLATHDRTAYFLVNDISFGSRTPPSPGATPDIQTSQLAAAIDLDSGKVRWSRPMVASSLFGIRFAADRHGFYYTEDTDDGLTLRALDAERGRSMWSVKVPADPDSRLPPYMQAGGGQLVSSLTAADDLLITVNLKGGMTAYDAKSGRRRWSTPMVAATAPVVVGDLVLTNDPGRVHGVDLRTGKVRWQVESPVALAVNYQTLAASKEVTAVLLSTLTINDKGVSGTGGTAGCVVLRTSDGKQLWALQEKPDAGRTPSAGIGGGPSGLAQWGVAVRGSTVFVTGGGRLRAYRADAG
ncbi:protein kinase domain-containing protein [Streptomyces alkaliterrae]|uniref:PQQ-binding-like beta-propeller repeat protein n=1 Tax=Streptomyces alkaliterrae TaxID=2213162 RepID=A0A5P0YX65_9ACTN|nr:serine/threonine-protein kinase [Streptomyces alkaliterrae]MBB1261957.1 serine/threonine-protein kinase [Streptomyces alkaliterrae]MQS04883.1 PQQ-binding-like beta-propeller repeat protein [Streptomyces alkaliterrae]